MNTIQKLSQIREQFSVLGSLKPNERLYISRDRFGKYCSPVFSSDSGIWIVEAVKSVLEFLSKSYQHIDRKIRGQRESTHIAMVHEQINSLIHLVHDNEFHGDFYPILKELNQIRSDVESFVLQGLGNYSITYRDKKGWLKRNIHSKQDREKRIDYLKIRMNELSQALEAKIQCMQNDPKFLRENEEGVSKLMSSLYFGDPIQEVDLLQNIVVKRLTNIFGEKAVQFALKAYHLEKEVVLSGADFHALLIGIVTNLTMEDLQIVYDNRSKLLLVNDHFPKDFDHLTEDELYDFLTIVRSKRLLAHISSDNLPYAEQLSRDSKALESMSLLPQYQKHARDEELYIKHVKHFGYSEFLSRDVIYSFCATSNAVFRDGVIVPCLDQTMKLQCLEGHSLHHGDGLFGVAFLPVRPDVFESVPVNVVFRGTYDRDSMNRDISFREKEYWYAIEGPGRNTFLMKKEQMIEKLTNLLLPFESCTLNFMGHSLGGSDAQRMCAAMMDAQLLSKISGMELHVYNAPPVEENVSDQFVKAAGIKEIPISLRYFDCHYDAIQLAGGARLGYRKDMPDNLTMTVMTFSRTYQLVDEFERKVQRLGIHKFFLYPPIKPLVLQAVRRHEAHTKHFFRTFDVERNDLNITHIADLRTNHPDDCKYTFGKDNTHKAEKIETQTLLEGLEGLGVRVSKKIAGMSPLKLFS